MDIKISDCVESAEEEFSESFNCCVCLDLLYKPVVLTCGHVSCFWCVHKSMDGFRKSTCPICRHPYYYFPAICHMLHFLLIKMYPVAYKRRENQVLEVEEKMGCFSPQFVGNSIGLRIDQGMTSQKDSTDVSATSCSAHLSELHSSNVDILSSMSIAEEEKMGCFSPQFVGNSIGLRIDQGMTSQKDSTDVSATSCSAHLSELHSSNVDILSQSGTNGPLHDSVRNGYEENNVFPSSSNGVCNQPLMADVLCAACKQLLYRPAVLNCGHVYCETCIVVPENEMIICKVCQCPHPVNFLQVCLEFSQFLEEVFPKEYALRRETVKDKQVQLKHDNQFSSSARISSKGSKSHVLESGCWSEHGSKVHMGVGCDYCGMFPIVGDRYQCQDCKETIGFDLCGDCYNTGSKLPGRFNQQHTPDHKFRFLKSFCPLQNTKLRFVAALQEHGMPFPATMPTNETENSDDSSTEIESGDADEVVVVRVTSDDEATTGS